MSRQRRLYGLPACPERTCFSNRFGACTLLTARIPDCPFYKTKEQYQKDKERYGGYDEEDYS